MALHEPELPFYYFIVCRNKIVKGKMKKTIDSIVFAIEKRKTRNLGR